MASLVGTVSSGAGDAYLPDLIVKDLVEDADSDTATALEAAYATILTATSGDETATINAFLAAASPLGAKRLVGDFTISDELVIPAGLWVDASAATVTQTGTSKRTLTPGQGATIFGGKLVGRDADYVAGYNSTPVSVGVRVAAADVTLLHIEMVGHAHAGVYATAANFRHSGLRIRGVGHLTTIPSVDATCFGVYLGGGCTEASFTDFDAWDVSIGIIGSFDSTFMSLNGVRVSDVHGQHGVYLQNGTGLNAQGLNFWNTELDGIKVQLGGATVADSVGMVIGGVTGHTIGDTLVKVTNSAADLSAGTGVYKFRGVSLSNIAGTGCGRVLYAGSIRGGSVTNISGSATVNSAFTFLDVEDVTGTTLTSVGSGEMGLRLAFATGSSSKRVSFHDLHVRNPAGDAVTGNEYGIYILGVTDADWVDLTIDGVDVSSDNATMIYGLFYGSGDQETFTLRNARITDGATADVRLAAGPRAVKEWTNVVTGTTVNFPTDAIRGTGLAAIHSGSASPEGVVTARIGSLYLRRTGGAGTTIYAKQSGENTNTGWVAGSL